MSGPGPDHRFSESLKLIRVVVVLWEGKRVKGGGAKRRPTGWDEASFVPTSPIAYHIVPGT